MPFTAAHPLAIAPLMRVRWLDATCLVFGSMAPDFEYFVRAEQVSTISHTLRGLGLFDVPVALALAAVWHALVVGPALLVAPAALAARARLAWRWTRVVPCALSALIGSVTHLAWDACTHARGWLPLHYRALKQPVALPVVGPMALHRVLQHGSTIVGLAVLALLVVRARRPRRALPAVPRAWPRTVMALLVLAFAALAVARLAGKHRLDPGDVIAGAIGGGLAGVIVASALLYRRAAPIRAGLSATENR